MGARDASSGRLSEALGALVARPVVLIGLDFDGCLSPIVPDPAQARPVAGVEAALAGLARTPGTTVAVVSGRPAAELPGLIRLPPEVFLVGSHGAEFVGPGPAGDGPAAPDEDRRRLLERLEQGVAGIVSAWPGTVLERKPNAVVLHTRRAGRPEAEGATAQVLAGPATWPGVHAMQGKEVVELAVTRVTKGDALRRLRDLAGLPASGGGVLYAGDDVTDEHAFAVLDDDSGDVTIKVGEGETAARHRVASPEALARVLAVILAGRPG